MEEWIQGRIASFKKIFGDSRISETELEWIEQNLESAWSRGEDSGRKAAFELIDKCRNESK